MDKKENINNVEVKEDKNIEIDKVLKRLDDNNKKIEKLNETVENLTSLVVSLSQNINSLNETIDIYKKRDLEQTAKIRSLENDEKFDYIKDIVMEVIRVRDICFRKLNSAKTDEIKECYTQMLKHLDVSLSRFNVNSYSSTEGDKFNPTIHVAQSVVTTDNKKLNEKICNSLSCGYILTYTLNGEDKKKIISYEKVAVYEYVK